MDRYLQDKASATAELLTLLVQARLRLSALRRSRPVVWPASTLRQLQAAVSNITMRNGTRRRVQATR